MKTNYRKIYESFHGYIIPKGYHIHHIDGNRNNNDISNLEMLSPDDHANKHGFLNNWIMAQEKAGILASEKLKTPEMRLKMSVAMKNSQSHKDGIQKRSSNIEWKRNVAKACRITAKTRESIPWNKGKKGIYTTSDKTKSILIQQRTGRKWFNDGTQSYFIHPENAAPHYNLGRK